MPVSNFLHVPAVLHFTTGLRPSRILDVGVGMGTYGFLLRQFLDVVHERVRKETWEITIDGVELFDGYRNPVWAYAYNSIAIEDARNYVPKEKYDLVLLNDIIEHVTQKEAEDIVNKFLNNSKIVLITTPNREYPQGSWGGNDAEAHECLINGSLLPDVVTNVVTGVTTCYLCSRDLDSVRLIKKLAKTCPSVKPRRALFFLPEVVRRVASRFVKSFGVGKL